MPALRCLVHPGFCSEQSLGLLPGWVSAPTTYWLLTGKAIGMGNAVFELIKLDLPAGETVRWALDAPGCGEPVAVGAGGVHLAGWLLSETEAPCWLALRCGGQTRCYPLNVPRPDVIRAVLGEEGEGHARAVCGFSRSVPFIELLEIGVEREGVLSWFAQLKGQLAD